METLDFVFWFRQLVGFSIGLTAGMLHLTGMFVILGFVAAVMILSNMYAYKVLNVSDEDFQNNELTMEGLVNSFGIFLVSITGLLVTGQGWTPDQDDAVFDQKLKFAKLTVSSLYADVYS
jgi:hypothetical protein